MQFRFHVAGARISAKLPLIAKLVKINLGNSIILSKDDKTNILSPASASAQKPLRKSNFWILLPDYKNQQPAKYNSHEFDQSSTKGQQDSKTRPAPSTSEKPQNFLVFTTQGDYPAPVLTWNAMIIITIEKDFVRLPVNFDMLRQVPKNFKNVSWKEGGRERGRGRGRDYWKRQNGRKKKKESVLLNKVLFNGVFVIKCFQNCRRNGGGTEPYRRCTYKWFVWMPLALALGSTLTWVQ